jgi:hypothetical protein
MKAEDLFTSTLLSYKKLLSTSDSEVPTLRSYCRSGHVSYPDFLRWAKESELSSGIIEIDRSKRRLKNGKGASSTSVSGKPCEQSGVPDKPLLYPLHIITDSSDRDVAPVVTSAGLRHIHITYPNGVHVSLGEADRGSVYFLVHGKES